MSTPSVRKAHVIYNTPVLVDRQQHAKTRILAPANYAFAKHLNSVVLTGVEFAHACVEYPVVFTKVSPEQLMPCAMLGLRKNENLYIDPVSLQWKANYLPAFIRRYPFILTEIPLQGHRLCLDSGYPGFNDTQGEALFTEDGKNSPYLDKVLQLQNQFRLEFDRTGIFCKKLQRLDLLTPMNTKAKIEDGSEFRVNGVWTINEKKMLALPQNQAMELFRPGELSWVYSHLISLNRMNSLAERLALIKREYESVS